MVITRNNRLARIVHQKCSCVISDFRCWDEKEACFFNFGGLTNGKKETGNSLTADSSSYLIQRGCRGGQGCGRGQGGGRGHGQGVQQGGLNTQNRVLFNKSQLVLPHMNF